jgi:hypothetical protein
MSLRVLVAEKRYVSLPRAMLVRENTVVLYFIAGARPAVKFSSHSEGRRLQHRRFASRMLCLSTALAKQRLISLNRAPLRDAAPLPNTLFAWQNILTWDLLQSLKFCTRTLGSDIPPDWIDYILGPIP